jgi:hypothetical protein
MSQWTHVAAVIRIDDLCIDDRPPEFPDVGNMAAYGDSAETWARCDIPRGSEGSLQHTVWRNPKENHVSAYTVTVWGDLRDYDNEEEIVAYLERITSGRTVRAGIAEIDTEGRAATVVQHTDDGWVKL